MLAGSSRPVRDRVADQFRLGVGKQVDSDRGLELRLTERGLRFYDPATGQDLPNLAETDEARQAAETRLAQEAQPAQPRKPGWSS